MWNVSLASALENTWFRLTFSWQMHINLTDLCKHVCYMQTPHGFIQETEHSRIWVSTASNGTWGSLLCQSRDDCLKPIYHSARCKSICLPFASCFAPSGKRLQRPKPPLKIPLSMTPPNITLAPLTQCLDFSTCNAWPIGSLVISLVLLTRFLPSHFGDENTVGCVPSLVCDMPT